MKLRNKKTGEIGELKPFVIDEKIGVWIENKSYPEYRYNSLTELNEEWEDYKEKGWYITENGEVRENRSIGIVEEESEYREIGNYFETEEEAEKAVEKLKVWNRLKDKGFRFDGWKCTGSISFTFDNYYGDGQPSSASDDLDLLFGGEE